MSNSDWGKRQRVFKIIPCKSPLSVTKYVFEVTGKMQICFTGQANRLFEPLLVTQSVLKRYVLFDEEQRHSRSFWLKIACYWRKLLEKKLLRKMNHSIIWSRCFYFRQIEKTIFKIYEFYHECLQSTNDNCNRRNWWIK